jgi:hypothetical protein
MNVYIVVNLYQKMLLYNKIEQLTHTITCYGLNAHIPSKICMLEPNTHVIVLRSEAFW